MDRVIRQGEAVFACAMVAFGFICLTYAGHPPGNIDILSVIAVTPVLEWIPGGRLVPYLAGVVLIGAGAALLASWQSRRAVLAVSAAWAVWVLLLHAPRFVTPFNPGVWTAGFEALALAGAALILAGRPATDRGAGNRALLLGRICYGIALPIFGIQHFMYAGYVATLVPAWIPGRLFWAYFTGVAHCLGGLAIATGIKARLAATLAGAMFGSWVFIVHLPLVVTNPGARPQWTSLVTAMAMCGAAWIVARSLATAPATAPGSLPVEPERDFRVGPFERIR